MYQQCPHDVESDVLFVVIDWIIGCFRGVVIVVLLVSAVCFVFPIRGC